ncbi:CaiB/BaiF CoA transferase family protein [Gordonia terrae]|uniref:CoA transferase n=2 Tax=Gordonia terrae TaxID=2055 RepID=A0AAD0NW19_9ACTN|nr:CoA transferase [Gordonia terrae]VTR07683.1 bile acid-inducible operon protein F [Clostridioides difficile]ANY23872.1 CoA-transferase [Gordonia terrae]AWO84606.1 CoA transferase [Gordonia terrae]VTS55460.1 Formyl-coenzyme A transferase [Gordonia terrae]GAB42092.1 putative CoA-transferase [Gordonia terrae NBRC 100016]
MNAPEGALSGVRVLDVTQVMAGAYCSLLLADMGADVIKIERPVTGDDTRRMSASTDVEASPAFVAMNRNKRGLALDLKSAEGADVLRRLVADADILVENFRPGAMDRLGLGYDDLKKINPALVYCSISGFGATGPYRDLGGFDLVAQAMSGLLSVTGTAAGDPVKVGVPICDLNAGLFGAFGVLNAYIHRLTTGQGQHVDTSLLEAGVAATVWESNEYFTSGRAPQPTGSSHRLCAPYQALPTADGHIAVGAANQRVWEKLCTAIGRTDLLDVDRYSSNAKRMLNQHDLAEELGRHLSTRTTAEWVELMRSEGVPCGPIYDMAQVHSDPHMAERGITVRTEHPVLGEVAHLTVPVRMSETPTRVARTAPLLGQHSREVLADNGFDDTEIETLFTAGIVGETVTTDDHTDSVRAAL